MIPQVWNSDRRLVPRWRSLRLTIAGRELASSIPLEARHNSGVLPPSILEKLYHWRRDNNIISAGELVEAALVEGMEGEAIGAARFLLSETSTATTPLRRLAALALKRAGHDEDLPAGLEIHQITEKRIWRQRTRLLPQSALAWVELALMELVGGDKKASYRSMLVALTLSPNNRHVLRSAARLFLHLEDPERAYSLIATNAATPSDPWLIAAELSLCELAKKKPKFYRNGLRLADEKAMLPRQLTELAGALGTLELISGKRKRARDFFQASLIDPTGNAVAQAEWASPEFNIELVSRQRIGQISDAEEAHTFHLIRENNLQSVAEACWKWSDTEPYSIRPFEVGVIVSAYIGNYSTALKFADTGLLIRAEAAKLLNGRAFSLANLGRLDEAEKSLRGVSESDEGSFLIAQANRGLIALRRGNIDEGKRFYNKAIDGFKKQNALRNEAVARAYFAREAARAGLPEATFLIKIARADVEKYSPGHMRIIEEANSSLNDSPKPVPIGFH